MSDPQSILDKNIEKCGNCRKLVNIDASHCRNCGEQLNPLPGQSEDAFVGLKNRIREYEKILTGIALLIAFTSIFWRMVSYFFDYAMFKYPLILVTLISSCIPLFIGLKLPQKNRFRILVIILGIINVIYGITNSYSYLSL